MSLGMLTMMRQEHMKTASVSLGVLAGVWQERVKRASVTMRMLQQPRRSGLRVLQQGARIPAAEQLASAGAAATALWRLICGATESPKKPFPDLGPLQNINPLCCTCLGAEGPRFGFIRVTWKLAFSRRQEKRNQLSGEFLLGPTSACEKLKF